MPAGDGTPRTYSIVADTAAGSLNSTILTREIALDATVTANLLDIATVGDVMDLFFDAALSAGEIIALDAIVTAHVGLITVTEFQFFENNPAQQITTQVWTNAFSMSSAPMSNGIYRLSWNLELRVVPTGALNSAAVARFRVDGSRKADAWHRSIEWSAFAGWDRKVFAEGEISLLEIDFRREPTEGGNDSVEIRKLKMGIELMG